MSRSLDWLPNEKHLWHIIKTPEGKKVEQIVAHMQNDYSYQIGFRVISSACECSYCIKATRTIVEHLFKRA